MLRYLLGRIAGLVATLVVASFIVFGALYLVPGDPASNLLSGMKVTPELVASVREQYHLNDPFFVRYWDWVMGLLHGDFGQSLHFRQDVAGLILSRLPTTMLLVLMAGLLIVIGGLAVGAFAAFRPGIVDRLTLSSTAIVAAIPMFVSALVLIYAFSSGLGWFPAFGNGSGFWDRVYHLILPAIALAIAYMALVARVTRSSMRAELRSEHVFVARGRGITGERLFFRHVLRNALPPVFTLAGVVVAGLLVSSQIVEVAFGLSGIGSLLVQSVQTDDFPVVQAITMIVVFAFVITNLVIDLLLPLVDPRMRRKEVTR